jgi:Mce-associated membrane protein
MPNRSRPRIAGQRRTSSADTTDTRTTDTIVEPEAIEAPAEVTTKVSEPVETPAADVSPATSEPSKAVEETSEEPPKATGSDDKSRSLGGVLAALLAVLVVLVMTFAVVLGIKAWQGKEAEDARDQAAAAGRKAAETALSYDYRDLNKSFAAARATMTPEFAAKFDETAKVAGELATKTKATVRAEVREVGVRDGDADRVTLIIFVNQTTTSTITQGKPRVDLNRTRFVMVRKGDQWLVQEIAGL